jgi:predicted transcriptional regulator
LKFLTTSSVRNKILISVREGVKDLGDLKDELGLDASTIIHSVRAMESEHLPVGHDSNFTSSNLFVSSYSLFPSLLLSFH